MWNAVDAPNQNDLFGAFGLERETLRVTFDGKMAQSAHPFPNDRFIVRDFCENQVEINTGVHTAPQDVIDELATHTRRLSAVLKERGERLWFYSNPPPIKNDGEIPIAMFAGYQKHKHDYRVYLSEKYGKYVMTLSGIHVNYSLSETLIRQRCRASEDFVACKNRVYLRLAESLLAYGWILNLLLSASPVCDGSFFAAARLGRPEITRYASVRCGENGYWNSFSPHLVYDSIRSYALSIQRYIESGALTGESELYYPIRLKPRGANRLNILVQNGVNHIEIRNVDINPFAPQGIDARDLQFIELLILYLVSADSTPNCRQDQDTALQNYKNAALLDIDEAKIRLPDGDILSAREAGLSVLRGMKTFFTDNDELGRFCSAREILGFQKEKLAVPGARYAERVIATLRDSYITEVLKLSDRISD